MRGSTAGLLVAVVLTTAFAFVSSGPVGAQAKKGDADVSAQLDRIGLKYTVTKSGNYSIDYDLDGGRSQTVYMMGSTDKVDSTEVRELWSRAGTFKDVPTADQMQNLLEESGSKKIGFWALEESDSGGYTVYFSVKVPTYLKDNDLSSLLEYVANISDEKEKELFNSDDE